MLGSPHPLFSLDEYRLPFGQGLGVTLPVQLPRKKQNKPVELCLSSSTQ